MTLYTVESGLHSFIGAYFFQENFFGFCKMLLFLYFLSDQPERQKKPKKVIACEDFGSATAIDRVFWQSWQQEGNCKKTSRLF